MQYDLTRKQIALLLANDDQFRADMVEVLASQPKHEQGTILQMARQEIRTRFPQYLTTEKISAIKYIQARAQEWKKLADALNAAGYECFGGTVVAFSLGLAAAKRFVESC